MTVERNVKYEGPEPVATCGELITLLEMFPSEKPVLVHSHSVENEWGFGLCHIYRAEMDRGFKDEEAVVIQVD